MRGKCESKRPSRSAASISGATRDGAASAPRAELVMLGTGTPMLFDSTVSVVKAVTRWLEFYKHESCGKCTPCREGTYFVTGLLERFEHGHGTETEMQTLFDAVGQITGRSFCALGDAAASLTRSPLAPSQSRCRGHVLACQERLREARTHAAHNDPPELLALALRGALGPLGEMTGAVYTNDLLDRVFSRFCIGK